MKVCPSVLTILRVGLGKKTDSSLSLHLMWKIKIIDIVAGVALNFHDPALTVVGFIDFTFLFYDLFIGKWLGVDAR